MIPKPSNDRSEASEMFLHLGQTEPALETLRKADDATFRSEEIARIHDPEYQRREAEFRQRNWEHFQHAN